MGENVLKLPTWPVFADDEIAAVSAVLASGKVNYWTGDQVKAFEQAFAAHVGTEYAIALANGTVALELALYALDIGPGDEVIVPARTFIATASAVVARGAKPVVVDVDFTSQNIAPDAIAAAITDRTRAIIPVHLAGWPADMTRITALAEQHQLAIIEDCAQAHGATYHGRQVGSFGQINAFSFCQDKIITTGGEGGMLTTNDPQLYERARSYKDHGKNFAKIASPSQDSGFRYVHDSFGTNWRMTEMQAAIGLKQLAKLPLWLQQRAQNARILQAALADLPGVTVATPPSHISHAYYKFYLTIEPTAFAAGWDRHRVLQTLTAQGVPSFTGSCPTISEELAFKNQHWTSNDELVNAKRLGETSLMFLIHPSLQPTDMHTMATRIKACLQTALQNLD